MMQTLAVADIPAVDPTPQASRPSSSTQAAIAARLGGLSRTIEGQFLKTGDVLSTAVDGVGGLIAALDKLASALDETMVEATSRDLETAATDLRGLPASLVHRRVALETLESLSHDLGGHITQMHQNLAYLRVVAIYIKIAAGGVEDDNGGFALFAQEIADSIAVGRQHLESFDKDLRLLEHDLCSARIYESNLRQRCGELVPDAPDAIEANAHALAVQRIQVAGVAKEVGRLARDIRKKVGGVLVALQIGDITRQRVEHVQYGLELLERLDADLPQARRTRIAVVLHDLLTAQLEATVEDFHAEMEIIDQNMAGIAADTRELLKLQDLAYGRADRAEGDFLGRLETHVGEALSLVAEMSVADQAALDVGAAVAAAAGRLSERIDGVQRIQADVHQMALNTTLRCARIGEVGKPITVIAVELRGHAAKLQDAANLTLTGLEALIRSAATLATASADTDSADARKITQTLQTALGRIQEAGGSADGDIVDLARQGAAVVEAMNQAVARMDCRREIGVALHTALGELSELSIGVSDDLQADDAGEDDLLQSLLVDIAGQYSMVQERDVHRAVVGHLVRAETQAATPPPADDLDDGLF